MSDDPADLPSNQADPTPTPGGQATATLAPSPNPFADAASTEPVFINSSGTASTTAAPDPTAPPPAAFVKAVNNAILYRLAGSLAKFDLIPASDKQALIQKIWQDPNIQQYWLANSGKLSDPTVAGTLGVQIQNVMIGQGNDPSIVSDYTNMLEAAGVPLTTSEQGALSGATQAINAPVPRPFGTSTISGYRFGDPLPPDIQKAAGVATQNGIDYGTPVGSRIVSPFAGTAHVKLGVQGYGNFVTVTLDNGWTIGFGHVASGEVTDGARVNPGDLIAISGANVGASRGAVTIVTWQNPSGKYEDPQAMMDGIFSGTTFSALGAPGAAGTGMPTVNKVLDTEYPTIKSDWQTYFGSPPSPEDVYDVLNHGTSPAQWSDYIRALPSHMDGLTQGQYFDTRQTADQVSTKVLGHPATDGIVKELHDAGLSGPQAVTNWYNEHGVTGIDPTTYNAIHAAQEPIQCGIFNECSGGADPRDIKHIYDSQSQQGAGPR